MAKVCDKSNALLSQQNGISAVSGCSSGGTGYLCDSYQPLPVSSDLTYGFAIQVGGGTTGENPNCCKCLEIQWVSGAASGKKMIAQVVTPGGTGGNVKNGDIIILTPGGGVGPFASGCTNQYGSSYKWYVLNPRWRALFLSAFFLLLLPLSSLV